MFYHKKFEKIYLASSSRKENEGPISSVSYDKSHKSQEEESISKSAYLLDAHVKFIP